MSRFDLTGFSAQSWWGNIPQPSVTWDHNQLSGTSGPGNWYWKQTKDVIPDPAPTTVQINWSPKITSPQELLAELLIADLAERFTKALVGLGYMAIGELAKLLRIPESAVRLMAEAMEFELHGAAVALPQGHPLAR